MADEMYDEEFDEDYEGPDLQRASLPVNLSYRENALRRGWILAGLLLLAALVAVIALGHPIFGGPPVVISIGLAISLIGPARHMRKLDHLRLEARTLTLNYRNGTAERLSLMPGTEFVVDAAHMIDTLVMTSKADQHTRKRLVAFDLLDLPAGHSLHDLCDFLNQLCTAGAHVQIGHWDSRHVRRPTIRRRLDWYRDPRRISRAAFQLSLLMVLTLCAGVYLGLSEIWVQFGLGGDRWVGPLAKLVLAYLIVHPVFKFLAIARLRDIGEAVNHRNVGGLLWKTTGGPLRLLFARGEAGANRFGLEPRF
jgi:hypothetical protein